jgi:transposase-like protein
MRSYSRAFKLVSLALVKELMAAHRIKFQEASRRIGVEESLLRRWTREAAADPMFAFPGRGHHRVSKPGSPRTQRTNFHGSEPPAQPLTTGAEIETLSGL